MNLIEVVRPALDSRRKTTKLGAEYWMARELQQPLGYAHWAKFEKVVEKARMACESTGVDPDNHIYPAVKMVSIGSGAKREQRDYYVSRYGAYLIAMNGNPRLPQIAAAQTYFAVQTRRQEIADREGDNTAKRVELRERVRIANKHLGDAAKTSGVQNWALFHDAGYRGLYGLGLKGIKKRKEIPPKENILDHAGRTELAANEFRITQTEQALVRDEIHGDLEARETHRRVGQAVRDTISELGGTMPEDLPPEPTIKKLEAGTKSKKQLNYKKNDTTNK
ncbi:DNA damage-inducible protein D [Candidatus Zixiibacteriota bacterium]